MALSPVLITKITPPRMTPRTLIRPRIQKALLQAQNHRLTILHAGAGYGKSTALAVFAHQNPNIIWYQITKEDRDPLVFLLHLCTSTQLAFPDITDLPLPLLKSWDGSSAPLPTTKVLFELLNALSQRLTEPTFLILDDLHLVTGDSEIIPLLDRFISLSPPNLHTIVATRPKINLPSLHRWQSIGQTQVISQTALAFSSNEVETLFASQYDHTLTPIEIRDLITATEGWIIALHLIWQSVQSGAAPSVQDAIDRQTTSLSSLFEVLAQDVFARQPQDIQDFLRGSATLQVMDPDSCNAIRDASDSLAMLNYLRQQELFVIEIGKGRLRYQAIFRQFLREQSSPQERHTWHDKAAAFFKSQDDFDRTIYHLLRAEAFLSAASLLTNYGARLLSSGRADTLTAHLDALSPHVLYQHPTLLTFLGDLARLQSNFQAALNWYKEAEVIWRDAGQMDGVSLALRSQARIYLDTVNPSRAEELLQRSLRLTDGTVDRESLARLYLLLAENKINAGKASEAEFLRTQAETLQREGPEDAQLTVRVLLRTGRLAEARRRSESMADAEQENPVKTPRGHRETQLLLSIIYAFQGEAKAALQAALNGISRGVELNSTYIQAVGFMRQAHAVMLGGAPDRFQLARSLYEKTIQISHSLATPRLQVEALWGLCMTLGQEGNIYEALQSATHSIEIATQVGDEWIASHVRLAMGANYILQGEHDLATEWLMQAVQGYQGCSDTFGVTSARVWQCVAWFHTGDFDRVNQFFPDVLALAQFHQYDDIFTRPTLLGFPNVRILIPLILYARQQNWTPSYLDKLLKVIGLPAIQHHPGFQLKIYTLGKFEVWQGDNPIPYKSWQRSSARQLFKLLITFRGKSLDRDQICEHLWPAANPDTAGRNFKIALSTMYNVLEPNRSPGSDSAYVLREGTGYILRPSADLWLDARDFLQAVNLVEEHQKTKQTIDPNLLKQAVTLFEGEFLPDDRYETWAAAEREHLTVKYLKLADQYCAALITDGAFEEAFQLTQRILSYDNCWERAYRYQMTIFHQLGDHGQIARTYQRCVETLKTELDVSPAAETQSLYAHLVN